METQNETQNDSQQAFKASQAIAKKPTKVNLIRFAFPTILSMLIMSTFGIVDGVFVSRLMDELALSAVGLVWPFMSFVMAIGFMLGVGGNALIAKKIGEGKEHQAREDFSLIIIVAFLASVAVSMIGFFAPDFILRILGVNENMHAMAIEYMQPFMFFLPAAVLGMVMQQFLITVGKAHYSAVMSLAAGALSAGLNYVFIYMLDWGLRGAALATSMGMMIPVVVGLVYFTFARHGSVYFVKPRMSVKAFKAIGRSCVNGASEMVTSLSMSITAVLMNNVLMRLDPLGISVGAGIIMWSGMGIFGSLFIGYSSGVAPIISYNYGKGDRAYLSRAFRNSLRLIGVLAVIAVVAAYFSVDALLWVYSVDEIIYIYGMPIYSPLPDMVRNGYLFIISAFLFMGFNGFGTMFFTALNNGLVSTVMSLFNGFIFYVILLYPLSNRFEINGVWAAVPAAEILQVFVTLFFLVKLAGRYGYAGRARKI
ncbi:MAG: MATE family efflux transporter [Defluviitaleaceae bacterium]|nr:MATE family efflux transporter [Defluviitaleaceae bacterium]